MVEVGKRVKHAVAGVVVGLGVFTAAIPLLWSNEGRAVRRSDSLAEGAAAVVEATAERVDAAHEGRLVHVSGNVAATAPLADAEFGIVADSLALERNVEMYQWREKRESRRRRRSNGTSKTVTEYEYSRVWSDDRIDSGRFHEPDGHENPGPLPLPSRKVSTDRAQLGAFTLDAGITRRFDDWERFAVPDVAASTFAGFRRAGAGFYRGADPAAPALGDVRVTFRHVPAGTYSFVARQAGTGLAPYESQNGDDILLIEPGTKGAKSMFAAAESANRTLTWLFRAIGFVAMWAGLGLVMRPLAAAGSVLPIVGALLEKGLAFVAFVLAASCSLLTIALAWVFHRPLLGIALLLAVAGLVYWLRRKPVAIAMPPPPPPGAAALPPPPPAA